VRHGGVALDDISDETSAAEETARCPRRPHRLGPPAPAGLELERALTAREAGSILGLHEITMQQKRARGEGPPWFRCGRAIRYRLGDVLAFRDARMVGKAP
jgi:hypothetical protein